MKPITIRTATLADLDAIAAVDTDENDKPTEDVLIEKVELAVYSTSES